MKIFNLGLYVLTLLAFVNCCVGSTYAQEITPVLKVNMKNGTNALITVTDNMRMEFDTDHIVIQHENGDFKVFHIADVSSFEHTSDKSGIDNITIDGQPMVRFASDGITVAQPGHHECKAFDMTGTLLLNREFLDVLHISNSMLRPGNIILQIDGTKTIKIRIK